MTDRRNAIDVANGLTMSGLAAAAWLLFPERGAAAFAAGLAIMTGNVLALGKAAAWIVGGRRIAAGVVVLVLKLGALFGAVWVCLGVLGLAPLPFGLGIAAIATSTLLAASKSPEVPVSG
jgi:hypothetical protein